MNRFKQKTSNLFSNLPQPNASTRVLAKCGFLRVDKVIDPDDGLVWRWEKPRENR